MRKSLALALVLMFAFTANLFAVGEARLTGKVTDAEGNPLADVKITAKAMSGKNFSQSFKTNAKGEYAIFLIDGTLQYEFTYEKEGYSGFKEVAKLKLVPEKNIRDIKLNKGGAVVAPAGEAVVDPAVVAYNEGVMLIKADDEAGAVAKFEESVKINPDLTAGHIALAKIYAKEEKWDKAIEAGEKVVAINPEDGEINTILAQAYEKKGNSAKAAEYKTKAPANPRLLFNDAAKLINAGKPADAEPLLRQAVELDPEYAQAHYELGMLLAGLSKNADAKAHLQKYIDLEPNGKDVATAKEMMKYIK